MTKTSSTFSRRNIRRWGCVVLPCLSFALTAGLVLTALSLLGGCASAPESRWEALSVAGTAHTSVFQNGLPRAGPYVVVAAGNGLARFYRAGVYVGTGTLAVIEPSDGFTRIDVAPNSRVRITGQ